MKATSIFGGVQIFIILISILKSKIAAVFLGTAGIGIVGLLNSTITLIAGITGFGLGTSAVRDVSAANSSGNSKAVALVVSVLRKWVWITGIFGTCIVIVFSGWLSEITFGNNSYIFSFILVSVTLLINQLNVGQLAILQGMQKTQYIAKASIVGSSLGLVMTFPLYYFLGNDGIVPAMIFASLFSFVTSLSFAKKIKIEKIILSRKLVFSEGKNMLKMGFLISLSGLLVTLTTYIIQLFINDTGGVAQVGLFTSGFSIINSYVGLIFTAMATDYFPRLSAVSDSNELCRKTINQQAEISILILGPIILLFLLFIKQIIVVLYSDQFVAIEEMVKWLAIAIFFKAAAWSIGFILLAKGESKTFFWNDLIGNFYMLIFDLIAYHFWGLTGLGVSFFVGYFVYFLQVFTLCRSKYEFSFDNSFIKIFIVQFVLSVTGFLFLKFGEKPFSYVISVIMLILSIYYSFTELDKRLDIKKIFNEFTKGRFKQK
ncbi:MULTISPECIES: oligosaccharide flippase family protein [Flavobacterium]|uniref:oligosaccharide flippase family protein n=1 Tax=Flavobacterium TaxID=237 RepID=UPI001642A353|nr:MULTISPECIES: oligosaccharide flippase family protein [Flavobacterium]MCR4030915.1 oligosaccharide flippase family protein [Flavobacterium panacis]